MLRFVRNGVKLPSNCTIARENAGEYILAPVDMKGDQYFLKHAIPWLVVWVWSRVWYWTYLLVLCNSWTCMYCIAFFCSPPFLFFFGCMRPICQNVGVHLKQLVIKAKILSILIYCYYLTYFVSRSSMQPTVQIWDQNSTILTPTNLLIVCLSSIMIWSELKVNAPVWLPDMETIYLISV